MPTYLYVAMLGVISIFLGLHKISADKIYPECFRKIKYGDCEYYKEFYDPVAHKTAKPFEMNLVKENKAHTHNLERSDFFNLFNFKWQGKSPYIHNLKKKKKFMSCKFDNVRIVQNVESPTEANPKASVHSLFSMDATKEMEPTV
jgi:hypothetical protein